MRFAMCALLMTGVVWAQEPAFEVASIRENNTPPSTGIDLANGTRYAFTPTGFSATRMDLFFLISLAYEIPSADLVARIDFSKVGPAVIGRMFNVEARGQGDTKAMLRRLLADRFGLRAHMEPRELLAWALTVKEPGKLAPSRYNCFAHLGTGIPRDETLAPRDECNQAMRTVQGIRRFRSHGTMEDFVLRVVRVSVREPVLNQTGLQGNFAWDVSVRVPEDRAGMPSALNDAFEEQLGLKLERTRASVDVLVIDAVHMPTPN